MHFEIIGGGKGLEVSSLSGGLSYGVRDEDKIIHIPLVLRSLLRRVNMYFGVNLACVRKFRDAGR